MCCSNVLSFCGRQSHNILKFASPADGSSSHLHNISSSGVSRSLVTTMVSIRVSHKHFRGGGVWGQCELEIQCSFEVSEKVLDCCPMYLAGFSVVPGQETYSISNVWPGGNSKVEEGANSRDVRNVSHLFHFFRCKGTLFFRQINSWVDGGGDRSASREAISFQDVQDVLSLGKMNGVLASVSFNFDSK